MRERSALLLCGMVLASVCGVSRAEDVPSPPPNSAVKAVWQQYARDRYAAEVEKTAALELVTLQLAEARASLTAVGGGERSDVAAALPRIETALADISAHLANPPTPDPEPDPDPPPPPPPSALTLSWHDNADNESGFKIERSADAGVTFVEIATVGANVTSYRDTTLVAGEAYAFRVRAFNAAGDSPYSNIASGVAP